MFRVVTFPIVAICWRFPVGVAAVAEMVVMRPWESTVIEGTLVPDPYVAAAVAPATLDRYSADPRKAFAEMFPVARIVVEAPSVTKRLEPTTKVLKGLVFETPTFEKLVVRAGDA